MSVLRFACPVCGAEVGFAGFTLDGMTPEWVEVTNFGDRVDGRERYLMTGLRISVSGWAPHSCATRTEIVELSEETE